MRDGPIEMVDGLKTVVVMAADLEPDHYILLCEDVSDDSVPLLVPAYYENAVLWRVDDWFHPDGPSFLGYRCDDERWLRVDGPVVDNHREVVELPIDPDQPIRLVLPGQDHTTWESPE